MYKYFFIDENMSEMMVMLKSLPTCTIVLDRNAKLVDINQPALKFFTIRSIDDFRIKKWIVSNRNNLLHSFINELMKGATITNKLYRIQHPDYTYTNVNFSACMLDGLNKKLFIFQFFVLTTRDNRHLEYELNQGSMNKTNLTRNKERLFIDNEIMAEILNLYVDDAKIQLFKKRYPFLSNTEIIICGLISLNMTVTDIAKLTKRDPNNVHFILYRLFKTFKLNSRKKLYLKLNGE